jgi:hypothetical protein
MGTTGWRPWLPAITSFGGFDLAAAPQYFNGRILETETFPEGSVRFGGAFPVPLRPTYEFLS